MDSPSEALPRPTGLPAALSLQAPEATAVNAQLSFLEDSGQVYWFLYLQVCDCYLQGDRPARARCLARFLRWGVATAAELAQALGISARTVTRARLRMQREGESSFGRPRQPRRRHGIEDPAVLARAAERLQGGASLRGVARELELCFETLRQYKREGLLPGIAAQRESGRAVGTAAVAGADLSEPAGNLAADVADAQHAAHVGVLISQVVQTVVVAVDALLEQAEHQDPPQFHAGPTDIRVDPRHRRAILRLRSVTLGGALARGEQVLLQQGEDPLPQRMVAPDVLDALQHGRDIVAAAGVELDVFDGGLAEHHRGIENGSQGASPAKMIAIRHESRGPRPTRSIFARRNSIETP